MKYVFEPTRDWELLESIAITYGKHYSQLNKKQKQEVDNIYTETIEQYDFEFYERHYKY